MRGPKLRERIHECIPIEEPSPSLSAIERLKNYDKNSIDLNVVDGMYHTTFNSEDEDNVDENISGQFREMFNQIRDGISDSTEVLFSETLLKTIVLQQTIRGLKTLAMYH